jgi:SagB-type dehydrogenase family enzyme
MTWAMSGEHSMKDSNIILLPSPTLKGSVSVEEAINMRRTKREFSEGSLTIEEWGQILWAAQGITLNGDMKKRTAPSAGALYPLDIYLVLSKSAMGPLKAGVFHYLPLKHALKPISDKDFTKEVAKISLYQYWMAETPGMILITAEYSRITGKYGDRGIRYAHIEAGHVAQNCFLQAESLKLNLGIVGAFEDENLIDLLPIPKRHEPILILPIGRSE